MNNNLIALSDSHCHLDFDELADQLERVIASCQAKRVHRLIVPAISPDNWQAVLQVCLRSDIKLSPCLGVHPWFLDDLAISCIDDLKEALIEHADSVVALGETGIDGTIAKEKNNLAKQIEFFEAQLSIAKDLSLPVIVHHRRSHQEVSASLKKYRGNRTGIVHAFSGSFQQAKQYLDLGFKLGIGGTITYPRAEKTRKTVSKLPLDCLVLETDAPAMPLYGYQGQVNTPDKVADVLDTLASLRSESKEEIALACEANLNNCLFS